MAENENSCAPAERNWRKLPIFVFFKDARRVFKLDVLGWEILGIAFPAALAVAADPIASLIDTAFIGHIGPVELAAAGVSIALFNQASRITIFPLVSITTSFVAEEDTVAGRASIKAAEKGSEDDDDMLEDMEKGESGKKAKNLEKSSSKNSEKEVAETSKNMGKDEDMEDGEEAEYNSAETSDHKETMKESTLEDKAKESTPEDDFNTTMSKSPSAIAGKKNKIKIKREKRHIASASTALLFGTILGLIQAIVLVFAAKPLLNVMGVKDSSPMLKPALKYLKLRSLGAPAVLLSLAMQGIFRGFKDTKTPLYVIGGLLLLRVVAVTFCVTLAASLAARLGATPMAAFQTCLQVWLTSSLLSDGLAVAGQAILACAFAEKDYKKATATATRVLQMSFVLGSGLALVVGIGLYYGAGIFSRDVNVLHLIKIGLPFVAATQPINSLAFVFDGVNFGASDFAYSAYSLLLVAIASIGSLFVLYRHNGFVGIWIALTIYMFLRAFVGIWRMGTGTGPWRFLRSPSWS
uniref:Protein DETOXIFICATION n=1 Tax=Fagus sylvatica TaxID=28930 RepID=A0A2N9HYZ5_FAGSY